jgi:hypothetical protein
MDRLLGRIKTVEQAGATPTRPANFRQRARRVPSAEGARPRWWVPELEEATCNDEDGAGMIAPDKQIPTRAIGTARMP